MGLRVVGAEEGDGPPLERDRLLEAALLGPDAALVAEGEGVLDGVAPWSRRVRSRTSPRTESPAAR